MLRKMLFHDGGTPIAETPQGVCLIPPESLRMLLAVTSAAERRWFEESRISMPGEPFPSEEWMEADKELTEALGPFTRGDADAED